MCGRKSTDLTWGWLLCGHTLASLSDLWTSGSGPAIDQEDLVDPQKCWGLTGRKRVGRETHCRGTQVGATAVPTISFQGIRSTVSSIYLHQVAVLAKPSGFQGGGFSKEVWMHDHSSAHSKSESGIHPGVESLGC